MTAAEIDALEARAKRAFHAAMMNILHAYVAARRAAGATDDEINREVEAQREPLLAEFRARLSEIRPLIERTIMSLPADAAGAPQTRH